VTYVISKNACKCLYEIHCVGDVDCEKCTYTIADELSYHPSSQLLVLRLPWSS
jgi:hypothetical protein